MWSGDEVEFQRNLKKNATQIMIFLHLHNKLWGQKIIILVSVFLEEKRRL